MHIWGGARPARAKGLRSVAKRFTVEHISASWTQAPVFEDLSFTLEPNTITALLGANGAGKSSILLALSGLLKLTGGKVFFGTERLDEYSPSALVQAGIIHVPEGRHVFSKMTVLENLQMGAYARKVTRKTVAQDIEKVFMLFARLAERRTQFAGTLSGGEQQMLAIGRAIMARPKVLLLDEPSLGLAPLVTELIFETIEAFTKEDITVLLVEQNAHLALSIAARGFVLDHGRIVLSGRASDLLADPRVQHAYLGGT